MNHSVIVMLARSKWLGFLSRRSQHAADENPGWRRAIRHRGSMPAYPAARASPHRLALALSHHSLAEPKSLLGFNTSALGSTFLSLRASFTQKSTPRNSVCPSPSLTSSSPTPSACHAPRPFRSARSNPRSTLPVPSDLPCCAVTGARGAAQQVPECVDERTPGTELNLIKSAS